MEALAPYRRIAATIRDRIIRGEIQPGDRIPSVREIMKTEGVATATATRVAAILREEGYAETIQGIGTVAALPRILTTGPDRLTMLRATGDGLRQGERTEIISAGLVPAPAHVADALDIEPGDQVVRRRRAYYDDQGTVALSTSWLPAAFAGPAPELVRAEPLPRMTFGLVEERTGRKAVRRRDVVTIRPVPEEASETLGVEAGTPTLTMTNFYWDQFGEVTEYAQDFLGPGRDLSADYDMS
ncbi:GntR family transcriptional regulator [Nonomuraea sp. NPDC050786]|uniref:GntR family transcriptional regulator n=1 Tax=Nonomuraea sp. NPDC050786 TaxID=3154840 RepID=UPI0033E7435B